MTRPVPNEQRACGVRSRNQNDSSDRVTPLQRVQTFLEFLEGQLPIDQSADDAPTNEIHRLVQVLEGGADRTEHLLFEYDELNRMNAEARLRVSDEHQTSTTAQGGRSLLHRLSGAHAFEDHVGAGTTGDLADAIGDTP